ncbi:unnamed protein product [Sphagnum troendelagicum]|uniref:THUMP domain-containing protein n=1 Tax=Sphagnum troendelagicum TaxID=128251 RepID=A0ABP0UI62_9BRYO
MPPWEQHGGVINMPRYLYGANAALLQGSHPGFLITCAYRREKSTTKEAMALLQEVCVKVICTFLLPDHKVEETEKLGRAEASDKDRIAAIPVTVSKDDQDRKDFENLEESGREPETYSCGEDQDVTKGLPEFSLVKLARMGMVYLSVSGRTSRDMVTVLSRLLADIHAGLRTSPQWCHRIFPVQATCSLTKGDLCAVVMQLVKDYLGNRKTSTDQPLKYAVAFNRRGVEDKHSNISSSTGDTSVQGVTLGKIECIDVIAGAVQTVTSNTVVDLVNPEMVVMVEVLPLVGSQSSLVCALSVLPKELVVTKPKLVVKPLVQPKKRKHTS